MMQFVEPLGYEPFEMVLELSFEGNVWIMINRFDTSWTVFEPFLNRFEYSWTVWNHL